MDKQMKGNRRERTRSVDPDTRTEGGGREDNEGWVAAATATKDFFSQKVRPCYYATTESERDREIKCREVKRD